VEESSKFCCSLWWFCSEISVIVLLC